MIFAEYIQIVGMIYSYILLPFVSDALNEYYPLQTLCILTEHDDNFYVVKMMDGELSCNNLELLNLWKRFVILGVTLWIELRNLASDVFATSVDEIMSTKS